MTWPSCATGRQTAGLPPPRLLGSFDPLLLGWASRAAILGDLQGIVTTNGLFRPFALVGGAAAGCWAWISGEAVLDSSAGLPAAAATALAAEAQDVRRYLAAGEPPDSSRRIPEDRREGT